MFRPNSIKTLMDLKNQKEFDNNVKSDDKNFKMNVNGDPNNPVEFAGITKSVLNDMDEKIEDIRQFRIDQKKDLDQQLQQNKLNLAKLRLQNEIQKKQDDLMDSSDDDTRIQEYAKQIGDKDAIDKFTDQILNNKIDPTIQDKIKLSEQKMEDIQNQYQKLMYVETDEVQQFKRDFQEKINLDFKLESKDNQQVDQDVDYKKYIEQHKGQDEKKGQQLKTCIDDIDKELKELEDLLK